MPARKITKNYRSLTGQFFSLKNNKPISFESLLEREFYLSLEFDRNVICYEEQPVKMNYELNGRNSTYTPDALVQYYEHKDCIYEIKYTSELEANKVLFKHKFTQIEEQLNESGIDFKFFTEKNLDSQYLENMRFVYNYANLKNEDKTEEAFLLIQTLGEDSIREFLYTYSKDEYKQNEIIPYFWKNFLLERIDIDLHEKIDKNTVFKVSE